MARHLLDYNPQTGESCYFDYNDGQQQVVLHHEQDITGLLDHCQALRNEGQTDRGIKKDSWVYARVPAVIQLEMLQKHGVDFWDPNQQNEVFHLINTEYPKLKTTHKNHMVGSDKKYYISGIKPATE